ncbi:hypothetical protein [Motiliproteus sp. SC1-56]|uniref:hypothetical protein n=1 Tax=Motiliproteus sp. SC1-56 TaxID=2799565 RepID=UPI001A8C83AC|nr:hypothetical protein [Motiliproteus sp. SC1-56]
MKKVFLAALLLLPCGPLAAAPAPWYLWQSKLDGRLLCIQSTPGEGWVRIGGPFRSSRCGR